MGQVAAEVAEANTLEVDRRGPAARNGVEVLGSAAGGSASVFAPVALCHIVFVVSLFPFRLLLVFAWSPVLQLQAFFLPSWSPLLLVASSHAPRLRPASLISQFLHQFPIGFEDLLEGVEILLSGC